jgi:hypothetical protein
LAQPSELVRVVLHLDDGGRRLVLRRWRSPGNSPNSSFTVAKNLGDGVL